MVLVVWLAADCCRLLPSLVGYIRLHHMLLQLAQSDTAAWRAMANEKIDNFLYTPDNRRKSVTPDLGRSVSGVGEWVIE